ncbi:MAG TPA: hypothetical protein VHA77_17465 [Xanthobacteraceae bacterium]|jgi:hypothetical protein|nr:hypothetical protein [Xanthobacteraceae bacterium]
MRRLVRAFWIFLALIFVFEAWLWDRLQPVVAAIVNVVPWGKVKQRAAALIEALPPWATLIVFVIPLIALLPLKVLEVWFLAHRNWGGALVTLVLAKLVGVGTTAFVFDVTRDKLLQMDWFRALYERVMWLRDVTHALVDPMIRRVRKRLWMFAPQRAGRAFRRTRRLRRRAYAAQARPAASS